MRGVLAVILAVVLGLAIGVSPPLAAGRTDSPMWFPATPGTLGPASPYLPISPTDPQPQPIWIIQIPL
jgi:hypothetical protein